MKDIELVLLLLIGICIAKCALPPQNSVIGIFTLPDKSDQPNNEHLFPDDIDASDNLTYIAASYVKFVQMSGAQVVPIFAFSNTSYLQNILSKINGVLFTGGGTYININNRWTQNADFVLKYSIQQNMKGNAYPVWGTCLGFQLLAYLTSGYDPNVLTPIAGQVGVKNTIKISSKSYLYNLLDQQLKTNLETGTGILYFSHIESVSPQYYAKSSKLQSFWSVGSTSVSSSGQQFISTLQGVSYPIYAVQFHPQKNLYEWKVKADRSSWGAEITQILSNKFVDVARRNKNRFDSDQQFRKNVVYNYKPQFTKMSFTQIYLFQQKVDNIPYQDSHLETE